MEETRMSIDDEEGPIAELIAYFDTVSWLFSIMKLVILCSSVGH